VIAADATIFRLQWLRGRLFLLDLAFFKYRRFALLTSSPR
jgi:hypothetical protein